MENMKEEKTRLLKSCTANRILESISKQSDWSGLVTFGELTEALSVMYQLRE
jgi:hypothetical protein